MIFLFLFFVGDVHSFLGNQTHKDHFKLLQMDGSSLLIGARNVIYNLSLNDLSENAEQVTLSNAILMSIYCYTFGPYKHIVNGCLRLVMSYLS